MPFGAGNSSLSHAVAARNASTRIGRATRGEIIDATATLVVVSFARPIRWLCHSHDVAGACGLPPRLDLRERTPIPLLRDRRGRLEVQHVPLIDGRAQVERRQLL